MTALELKNALAKEHLLNLHRLAVITESSLFFNADVVSLTPSLFTQEFEIKTSVADLRREACMIEMAKEWIADVPLSNKRITSYSKLMKHRHYMALDNPKITVPNEYSFFVPEDLEEDARKAVQGTPYGVCLLHKSIVREGWYGMQTYLDPFHWAIKPRRLHTDKLSDANFRKIMRRVSVESYYLREKVINGSQHI